MVDINLFKDDEEENEEGKGKKKEENDSEEQSKDSTNAFGDDLDGDLDFDKEEPLGGDIDKDQDADFNLEDDLDEDLDLSSESDIENDLDKELDDVSSLDDEEFLDSDLEDEEEIPDIEEQTADMGGKDYSFGEVKKKGVSPFLLALLGIVVIVALGYQFIYKPKLESLEKMQNNLARAKKPDMQKLIEQQRQKMEAGKSEGTSDAATTAQKTDDTPSKQKNIPVTQKSSSNVTPAAIVQNTGTLIEYFSQNNCLGTIIIDIKDKFFRAGYAASQPNRGQALAARVKSIFDIDKYNLSPEDGYKTNGQTRYWGVISGTLSGQLLKQTTDVKNFSTAQALIQWLENMAQNKSIIFKDSEVFPAESVSGRTTIPLRIKIEGNRNNLLGYLTILIQNKGNFSIDKMIITPVEITDFTGKNIKFVINLTFIN